jgi:hypothetical protein
MRAKTSKFKKTLPPPGVHVARLVQLIDWGSQVDKFAPDGRAKLEWRWELPEALHVFNEDKGEQPFVVERKYGNTLGKPKKRSDMGKAVEGMIGGAFVDDDENPFPLEDLVGGLCQLSIVNEVDGEYENTKIVAIMPLSKAQEAIAEAGGYPEFNDQFVFDMDNFNPEIWDQLPKWKQDEIAKTDEYAMAISGETAAPTAQAEPEAVVEETQQLPFEVPEEYVDENGNPCDAEGNPLTPPAPAPKVVKKVAPKVTPAPAPAAKAATGTPGTAAKLVAGQGFKKVAAAAPPQVRTAPVKTAAKVATKTPVKTAAKVGVKKFK